MLKCKTACNPKPLKVKFFPWHNAVVLNKLYCAAANGLAAFAKRHKKRAAAPQRQPHSSTNPSNLPIKKIEQTNYQGYLSIPAVMYQSDIDYSLLAYYYYQWLWAGPPGCLQFHFLEV